jgi:hypothetical protein
MKLQMSSSAVRCFSLLVCLASLTSEISAAPRSDQPIKPNFSGSWQLDAQASSSIDPVMKQIGAGLFDRAYAAVADLKASMHQTDEVLTVATRGPGFSLDQTLYLDGRSDSNKLQLLGATSLDTKTVWSQDDKHLLEIHQIRTTQGRDGRLTIERFLTDRGKTLVVDLTVEFDPDRERTSVRQVWRRQI